MLALTLILGTVAVHVLGLFGFGYLLFLGLDFPSVDFSGLPEDVFVTVVTGLGLILAVFVTAWLMAMLSTFHQWLKKRLLEVDAALVPFGQTELGKLLYGLSKQLATMVDEPDDPLIVKLVGMLHKTLPETDEMISPEQMSEAATTVTRGLSELLDGVKKVPEEYKVNVTVQDPTATTSEEFAEGLVNQIMGSG